LPDVELRVAHFDPHLIFQLMLTHLRLAYSSSARTWLDWQAIAQRDAERQPDAFIRAVEFTSWLRWSRSHGPPLANGARKAPVKQRVLAGLQAATPR